MAGSMGAELEVGVDVDTELDGAVEEEEEEEEEEEMESDEAVVAVVSVEVARLAASGVIEAEVDGRPAEVSNKAESEGMEADEMLPFTCPADMTTAENGWPESDVWQRRVNRRTRVEGDIITGRLPPSTCCEKVGVREWDHRDRAVFWLFGRVFEQLRIIKWYTGSSRPFALGSSCCQQTVSYALLSRCRGRLVMRTREKGTPAAQCSLYSKSE